MLRDMISRLNTAFGQGDDGEDGAGLSELEMSFSRWKRERRLLQAVEEQLIAERESARLQSIMDTGTTTILDRAYAPHRPIWPDRKLMLALTAAISLLLGGLAAIGSEYLRFLGEGRFREGWHRLLRES